MQEYRRLPADGTKVSPSTSSMMLDESRVLCKIFQRTDQLPPVQFMDDQGLSKALAGFVSHRDLPPGFRFFPTDEELIVHYLCHRATAAAGPAPSIIPDLDITKLEPWEMPDDARLSGQEWYFFSLQDRKYATGSRTNRATSSGYWKPTGKGRLIITSLSAADDNTLLGFKKTLVFYKGREPTGIKTSWVMHEYRLDRDTLMLSGTKLGGSSSSTASSTMLHDEWLLCRIFNRATNLRRPSPFLDDDGLDDDGLQGGVDSLIAFKSAAEHFLDAMKSAYNTPLFPSLPPIPCINDHLMQKTDTAKRFEKTAPPQIDAVDSGRQRATSSDGSVQ